MVKVCSRLRRDALALVGLITCLACFACPNCDHALWSKVRNLGAYRFAVHFDHDKGGDTYPEHVAGCPGYGDMLDGNVLDI